MLTWDGKAQINKILEIQQISFRKHRISIASDSGPLCKGSNRIMACCSSYNHKPMGSWVSGQSADPLLNLQLCGNSTTDKDIRSIQLAYQRSNLTTGLVLNISSGGSFGLVMTLRAHHTSSWHIYTQHQTWNLYPAQESSPGSL